ATSIPVVTGQSFSERQLLDGLMIHSANDFADSLARWDAGSLSAFVAKMNATAQALGMRATHYADPSGIDENSVSTAGDQLRLTDAAMAIPAFAAIVAQPTITVAGVGLLANYVPAVGTDGVVGVKSGFTQAAMGCVVLAAERTVAGRQVLVLAALTGQQSGAADPIRVADRRAVALIDAAASGVVQQTLVERGTQVGYVGAQWRSGTVGLVTGDAVQTLAWPGQQVEFTMQTASVRAGLARGAAVGTLVVTKGTQRFRVPVRTTGDLPGPSWHWRYSRP
ncbi:MAG TPA: hypothetical protein VE991_05965, partial [Acidimicrobiales bacterium]|nr:hypothetical protein [Acidimicrobiales bacterium]